MSTNIEMFNVLKEQLKKGSRATIGDAVDFQTEYDDKDVNIMENILTDILIRNGYKKPTNKDFYEKIKIIFKRKIDYSSQNPTLYVNLFNKCNTQKIYYKNNVIDYTGIFIFKNKSFISELLLIPEVIDYQKEYPEIDSFEKELLNEYMNSDNDKIKIIKWKNISDLAQERQNNIQTLVNRNKYLFNDNKASFVWLKFNDTYFLESLVKTFGYMNDKELLKWVIDKTLSDKNNKGEDFNSLFFMKDCSNKFVFHKETFEVLKENINNKMLEALENYVYYREENKELQTLPFKQKAQVLAYVLYIGEYFAQQEKYSSRFMFKFMGTFYEFDKEGDKYDEEFKKNNYYNLSDFKKLWEQAKEEGDGIGLPM
ncbi:hypothetical protein O2K51_12430 [Apibacter raozihei]|uniref:hypothetical protein n=1 Tax=Apibacter raozihei TaxID=2500547 RepID=UPI000FE417DB|nr:hypothetical protein [Apibacter raozihei]